MKNLLIALLFLVLPLAAQEKFETMSVKTGKVYNKVVVTNKNDAYVSIRHEAGTARVLFSDLDILTLKAVGGYDPKKAKAFLEKEKSISKEEITARAKSPQIKVPEQSKAPIPAAPPKTEVKPERLKLDVKPLERGKLEKSKGHR